MTQRVIIVGAGLAGLCCARELHAQGVPFLLLEASDGVGGRVRTDFVEGFRLDRGFQVLLTSYPEARRVLDYDALRLCPFEPGALVRFEGDFHQVTDPWRRPTTALASLFSPIGSLVDKLRVGQLRARSLQGSVADQFNDNDTTTQQALQQAGFSTAMIERFFRPFLGGIFLESQLDTSSNFFHFVFRMFSTGSACLPAEGMEAIPRQLAAALPAGSIRLGARVAKVEANSVTLEDGEQLEASAVVVAVEGPAAAQLLNGDGGDNDGKAIATAGKGVTNLYYAAAEAPITDPLLLLNGDGEGPINNVCVPTVIAPAYGPPDQSLISVSVLGVNHDLTQLEAAVHQQLSDWFGAEVVGWRHLRTYEIPYALPRQEPSALAQPERPVRWQPGIYVCGDHRDTGSIQGAMVSGRRAATALMADRTGTRA